MSHPNPIFKGLHGAITKTLLNLPLVRAYRVNHAFCEFPQLYSEFLKNHLGPQLLKQKHLAFFCKSIHTQMLLEACPELQTHIKAIFDNNKDNHGTNLLGIPVLSPSDPAFHNTAAIFISTTIYQRPIKKDIKNKAYLGKILTPEAFLQAHHLPQLAY